jgi:hypothetical protein
MLRAKKELLFRLEARVSCLFVVAALMSAPIGRVAHARVTALVPAQGVADGSAHETDSCGTLDGCKIVCRGGDSKLLGPWSTSPRSPELFKFHALLPCMPRERVQSLAVDATCSLMNASRNQAAYLFTCRLRL